MSDIDATAAQEINEIGRTGAKIWYANNVLTFLVAGKYPVFLLIAYPNTLDDHRHSALHVPLRPSALL